ncbi:hypothetical protein TTRE_0000389501 [Trichuris trichiura]|uniref:Uncharacterized protein n=1 Tax=Trichuris trichiura TaxID=36087 RepID=A0A077Z573_TRITR|nr:hypothetical protein TTRE_0000389501 [Trichuris trichiura]
MAPLLPLRPREMTSLMQIAFGGFFTAAIVVSLLCCGKKGKSKWGKKEEPEDASVEGAEKKDSATPIRAPDKKSENISASSSSKGSEVAKSGEKKDASRKDDSVKGKAGTSKQRTVDAPTRLGMCMEMMHEANLESDEFLQELGLEFPQTSVEVCGHVLLIAIP